MYTIESNDIKFNIIYSKNEIVFIDENNETLTWVNNHRNKELVKEMIIQVTGEQDV